MNKNLKNLLILPLCASAIALGYVISERQVDEYFHPTYETKTLEDYLSIIGPTPLYYKETTAGQFLSAGFAQRHKDWKSASEYLHKILEKNDGNVELEKQAMVLAMGSGEVNRAIALARKINDSDQKNVLAMLFLVMDAFKRQDYASAESIVETVPKDSLGSFITPVLEAWASAAHGEFDISKVPLNSLYAYHVLLIGQMTGNLEKAKEFTERSLHGTDVDPHDLAKIADLYASFDKKDKALELYKLIETSGFGSRSINERIEALAESKEENTIPTQSIHDLIRVPDIQSVQDGVGLVFLNMSEILARDYSDDSAMIFANMTIHLAPKLSNAHIVLGSIKARNDRYNDAIDHFLKVDKSSQDFPLAQMEAANLYEKLEKREKAVSVLEKLYKETKDVNALIQIGHIYRVEEDFKAAVNAYNRAANTIDNPIPEEYWHLLYARGMAHERMKNFESAEEDLLKALAYQPDHPFILNYLGYSWADQGVNLDQSLEMIERAASLEPGDGYIADSLGWVLYRMDQFEEAVPHIERAVQLQPYDPVINDHLGDAYWQTGRRLEARFQWERALNHAEEEDLKVQIDAKLKNGLEVTTPAPSNIEQIASEDTHVDH